MEKVLVTGAAGFIGSHLCELLVSRGISVIGVDNLVTGKVSNLSGIWDNSLFEFEELDVVDLSTETSGKLGDLSSVFHLAALADIVPSIEKPDDYFVANVEGTFKVVEFARNAGIRNLVYAASSSCYGIPTEIPTTEEAAINPQYPYALTKFLGEQIVLHWATIYGFNATSLRLFNVFGPRARTNGNYGAVFGVFLAQKLAHKPLTIVGDGNQTRDFTQVSDVVEAFFKAAFTPYEYPTRILNVGSGQTISVNKLADLIGGPSVHIPRRPGEPDCTFADISKIQQVLDWKPNTDFETAVKEMLRDLSMWQDAPIWTPKDIEIATKQWFKYLGKGN